MNARKIAYFRNCLLSLSVSFTLEIENDMEMIDHSLIQDYEPETSPVRQNTRRHNTTPTRDQTHQKGLELDIIHAISQFQAILR